MFYWAFLRFFPEMFTWYMFSFAVLRFSLECLLGICFLWPSFVFSLEMFTWYMFSLAVLRFFPEMFTWNMFSLAVLLFFPGMFTWYMFSLAALRFPLEMCTWYMFSLAVLRFFPWNVYLVYVFFGRPSFSPEYYRTFYDSEERKKPKVPPKPAKYSLVQKQIDQPKTQVTIHGQQHAFTI